MDGVYENIDDYNPSRKRRVLIVFDDIIADIMVNRKFQAIINELFTRCKKLSISFTFTTQFYFSVSKDVRSYSTHYLIMKINNKRELKNIAMNHSADFDYIIFFTENVPENLLVFWQLTQRYKQIILKANNLIKMTVIDQIKILDDKVISNPVQYDLGGEAADISTL